MSVLAEIDAGLEHFALHRKRFHEAQQIAVHIAILAIVVVLLCVAPVVLARAPTVVVTAAARLGMTLRPMLLVLLLRRLS
jgi:hypothetical protein